MFLSVLSLETVGLRRSLMTDLNLPTCGIALVLLMFSLKLNRPKSDSAANLRKSFDFVGLYVLLPPHVGFRQDHKLGAC